VKRALLFVILLCLLVFNPQYIGVETEDSRDILWPNDQVDTVKMIVTLKTLIRIAVQFSSVDCSHRLIYVCVDGVGDELSASVAKAEVRSN
jgi:hypothetical protein